MGDAEEFAADCEVAKIVWKFGDKAIVVSPDASESVQTEVWVLFTAVYFFGLLFDFGPNLSRAWARKVFSYSVKKGVRRRITVERHLPRVSLCAAN